MSWFAHTWYHCVATYQGNWLRGDERGWRARHHREHVIGDYKNPPPFGTYDDLLEVSESLMESDAVLLDQRQREAVCDTLLGAFEFHKVEVTDLAVAARHYHLCARFPSVDVPANNAMEDERNPVPRYLLGKAHSYVSNQMRKRNIAVYPGGLFAKRPKVIPVESEEHFAHLAEYIQRHAREGAVVLSIMRKRI